MTSLYARTQLLYSRQTPEPTTSPLKHPLLASSPTDMNVFRAVNEYLKDCIATNPSISTEECEHINQLTRLSEKFFTRNNICEEENVALRGIVNAWKNGVGGKRERFLRVSTASLNQQFTLSLRNTRRQQRRRRRRQKSGSAKVKAKRIHHPTQQSTPHLQCARTWKYWTRRTMSHKSGVAGSLVVE